MKRIVFPVIVLMLTVVASVVTADACEKTGEKAGKLLLFQKCDASLIGLAGYDSSGCPNVGTGPWPIFSDGNRRGKLEYSLFGEKFAFSFQGHKLARKTNYTLIYYPDPWPGTDLICLGRGRTNHGGNIEIHGKKNVGPGLPRDYDANFNAVSPSGAVGAKIWLVPSSDVQCTNGARMLNWNPTKYLFEYNLIIYTQTH